jgi:hypothetical protein
VGRDEAWRGVGRGRCRAGAVGPRSWQRGRDRGVAHHERERVAKESELAIRFGHFGAAEPL